MVGTASHLAVPPATHLVVGYLVLSACTAVLMAVMIARSPPPRRRGRHLRRR